jgi:glycosyltransferase involved in cell wall biosynthesis
MDSMQPRPVLTVAVPLYNMEECVARCLDSLTHEDGPAMGGDLEILVVDDGSTDGSAGIARPYESRCPGLRLHSKANGGHGSAVDHALQVASGIYFLVVDSDDEVLPQALAKVVSFLRWLTDRGQAVDALILERAFEDEKTGKRRYRDYKHALPANRSFGWEDMGDLAFHETFSMHALVFRREHLDDVHLHLPGNTYYVDNLYTFTPLGHATRFFHLPFPLYVYHLGRPGQSVSPSVVLKHTDDRMRVSRAMVAERKRFPVTLARRQRRYLDTALAGFLIVTLATLTLSDRDDREQKKAGLIDWIHRTHPDTYRAVVRRPIVTLARLRGGVGRFVTRIGYRIADSGNLLF